MSDIKNPAGANENDIARRLREIVPDLWSGLGAGIPLFAGEQEEDGDEEAYVASQTRPAARPAAPAAAAPAPRAAEKKPEKTAEKKKPALDSLWKAADETVDWTDALGHDRPTDGLTGQKLWSFYHSMAEQVLAGDVSAYVKVLTETNPLGDLTDFVSGMVIRTPDSDRLECEFECRDEWLKEDARRYLGGMSLRVARDLFAALPVSEVTVRGTRNGGTNLDVTYRREQLLKKNFSFLDPAGFAEKCGGRIETD